MRNKVIQQPNQQKVKQVEEALEEPSIEEPPPEYDSDSDPETVQSYAKVVKTEHARTIPMRSDKDPRIKLSFKHQNGIFEFSAIADSGTTKTIISMDIAKKQGMKLYSTAIKLKNASNNAMKCEGGTPIKINGISTMALVSSALKNEILLSLKDMKKLGIVGKNFASLPVRITKADSGFQVIVDSFCKEYKDVVSDILSKKPMTGPDMTIHLKENAIPTKITTACKTPIHWLEPAQDAVDKLITQDVLQVETEPTQWIARGFFVPKGSPEEGEATRQGLTIITVKDLRLVVDFTGLNKYVQRPHWPFPSCQDVMDQIEPNSKYFAALDCTAGYHQIQLDRESQKLTTFLLPCGKYSFKRAPMGLNASSDEWCRRSDEALHGVKGMIKLVDDIIVFAPTLDVLQERVKSVLDKCGANNIPISKKKFRIGEKIKFAGFVVSGKRVEPDPERIAAIDKFPVPKNTSDVRSFLGLANQLRAFLPDLAQAADELRRLFKNDIAFQWLAEHQKAFEKTKAILTSKKIVHLFDPSKDTIIMTDASKLKGLGFAMVQVDKNGAQSLVMCGSRSLKPAEQNCHSGIGKQSH